jgi:hypothetical protein
VVHHSQLVARLIVERVGEEPELNGPGKCLGVSCMMNSSKARERRSSQIFFFLFLFLVSVFSIFVLGYIFPIPNRPSTATGEKKKKKGGRFRAPAAQPVNPCAVCRRKQRKKTGGGNKKKKKKKSSARYFFFPSIFFFFFFFFFFSHSNCLPKNCDENRTKTTKNTTASTP